MCCDISIKTPPVLIQWVEYLRKHIPLTIMIRTILCKHYISKLTYLQSFHFRSSWYVLEKHFFKIFVGATWQNILKINCLNPKTCINMCQDWCWSFPKVYIHWIQVVIMQQLNLLSLYKNSFCCKKCELIAYIYQSLINSAITEATAI